MKKQRTFYGVESGVNFHVIASKKPSKKTEEAIRALVRAANNIDTKRKEENEAVT